MRVWPLLVLSILSLLLWGCIEADDSSPDTIVVHDDADPPAAEVDIDVDVEEDPPVEVTP